MELKGKIIVACEKCHAINYYERFKWTCPKCGKRFRDKEESPNTTNDTSKKNSLNDDKKTYNNYNSGYKKSHPGSLPAGSPVKDS